MHVGEELDSVAGLEEHLEALFGQHLRFAVWIAGLFQRVKQDAPAQLAEAMPEHGLGAQQARANRPQVLDGYWPQPRRFGSQPVT